MVWIVGILKFISAFIGISTTGIFIMSCISSVVNPQLIVEGDTVREKNQNSRYMFLLITAVAWALVIAL